EKDGIGRARGVNDGDGFMFVSHLGDIYPSGFLPIAAGNVRRDDLVDVYRNAPLFRRLRDRSQLKGKCNVCEYRPVCGGSRARAYAMTGDYMEAEPFCAHIPPKWQRMVDQGLVEDADTYFARRNRWTRLLPVYQTWMRRCPARTALTAGGAVRVRACRYRRNTPTPVPAPSSHRRPASSRESPVSAKHPSC